MRVGKRPLKSPAFLWGLLSLMSLLALEHALLHRLQLPYWLWGGGGLLLMGLFLYPLCKQSPSWNIGIGLGLFLFGLAAGPYLEPPADPLVHLQRTVKLCAYDTARLPPKNHGLLHYSIQGLIHCQGFQVKNPGFHLWKLKVIFGLWLTLAGLTLFNLGRRLRLPPPWAFFGLLVTLLFMGTNRFGYFSYYALAPSYSSMLLVWLWLDTYFHEKTRKPILQGLAAAILLLPLLLVNHVQEAVFLVLFLLLWLAWVGNAYLWPQLKTPGKRLGYLFLLVLLLFILPQWEFFQGFLALFFPQNKWADFQDLVHYRSGLHLGGRIWTNRVDDSLAWMIFPPLFLSALLAIPKIRQIPGAKAIAILGIAPLAVYLVPLFHYIWVANLPFSTVYWRISYSSLYGYSFAFLLWRLELWIAQRYGEGAIKKCFYGLAIFFLLALSTHRHPPVYGKLDMYRLGASSWWPASRAHWERLLALNPKQLNSDPITEAIAFGVFGIPANIERTLSLERESVGVQLLINYYHQQHIHCLINLQGIQASWVPRETKHWDAKLAHTGEFYRWPSKGSQSKPSPDRIKANRIPNLGPCHIWHPLK